MNIPVPELQALRQKAVEELNDKGYHAIVITLDANPLVALAERDLGISSSLPSIAQKILLEAILERFDHLPMTITDRTLNNEGKRK